MVVTGVILPVYFIVFLGYLLKRLGRLDVRAVSRVQLYVLSPALVFTAAAAAEAETTLVLRLFLYMILFMGVIFAVIQGIGFLIKGDRVERNAMSLAAVFMNGGFYGIPVCMLAFGDVGVVYATIFVVCSATIQSTVGIFLASAGSRKASDALAAVLKVPVIHAIVLSRILVHFDILPAEPFMKMIGLLGRAAIPMGLLLLGMQLERIISGLKVMRGAAGRAGIVQDKSLRSAAGAGRGGTERPPAGCEPPDLPLGRKEIAGGLISAALRIAGGFAVALLILRFFEFDPTLRNVIIVESSMPTAVNVVVYATEFDCRARLVAIGILSSTLASILSITLILNYVG